MEIKNTIAYAYDCLKDKKLGAAAYEKRLCTKKQKVLVNISKTVNLPIGISMI